jgi:hypothetical protein
MNSKLKVFISYAREDHEIAEKIFDDLLNAGLSPWIDKKQLLPGQNWRTTIITSIKESTYFIALLSTNSVSKKGFVQKELKIALDLLDEFPPEDIFVIPVRVDDCQPLHEKIQYLHWADLFPNYEEGINQILNVLLKDKKDEEVHEVLNKQITIDSLTAYSRWKFPEFTIDEENYISKLINELKRNGNYNILQDVENIVNATEEVRKTVSSKKIRLSGNDANIQIRLALVLGDEDYMWSCYAKPISIKEISKYSLYKDQDSFNREKQSYMS